MHSCNKAIDFKDYSINNKTCEIKKHTIKKAKWEENEKQKSRGR